MKLKLYGEGWTVLHLTGRGKLIFDVTYDMDSMVPEGNLITYNAGNALFCERESSSYFEHTRNQKFPLLRPDARLHRVLTTLNRLEIKNFLANGRLGLHIWQVFKGL